MWPGLPGSSQAGCFLPSVTPHPGAGPRQAARKGRGVGSTTCGREISALGQEVTASLAVLSGGLEALGIPPPTTFPNLLGASRIPPSLSVLLRNSRLCLL